jgi:hypothetical protein
MSHMRNTTGLSRGWHGRRGDRREGRNQRIIRRAFAYADIVTTVELLDLIYPRIQVTRPIPEWRLASVRKAASRWAERILQPRSRPLLWKAKQGLFD